MLLPRGAVAGSNLHCIRKMFDSKGRPISGPRAAVLRGRPCQTAARGPRLGPRSQRRYPAMSLAVRAGALCLAGSCVLTASGRADDAIDLAAWGRIRDLGFNQSKVMETARHLTDGIGPRLTNSPNA